MECRNIYESETRVINDIEKTKLKVFEMWYWGGMLRVSWTERKTNEELLRTEKEKRTFMDAIEQGVVKWLNTPREVPTR